VSKIETQTATPHQNWMLETASDLHLTSSVQKKPVRTAALREEEEEERDLINDLKRYGRLAVAWNRHGFPVPRWTLTRYGPENGHGMASSFARDHGLLWALRQQDM